MYLKICLVNQTLKQSRFPVKGQEKDRQLLIMVNRVLMRVSNANSF